MTDDEILWQIERDDRRREERLRTVIISERGAEAMEQYDARMKAIRNGTERAEMIWHSISGAQRRVLLAMAAGDGRAYCSRSAAEYGKIVARAQTLGSLIRRDLVVCDTPNPGEELSVTLTEHGRFVVAWGSKHSCLTCRK